MFIDLFFTIFIARKDLTKSNFFKVKIIRKKMFSKLFFKSSLILMNLSCVTKLPPAGSNLNHQLIVKDLEINKFQLHPLKEPLATFLE